MSHHILVYHNIKNISGVWSLLSHYLRPLSSLILHNILLSGTPKFQAPFSPAHFKILFPKAPSKNINLTVTHNWLENFTRSPLPDVNVWFPSMALGVHYLEPPFLPSFTFLLCFFVPSNHTKLLIFRKLLSFMLLTLLTDLFTLIEPRSPLLWFNAFSKWLHSHCPIPCFSSHPKFKSAWLSGTDERFSIIP